jgi:hypothetical protein
LLKDARRQVTQQVKPALFALEPKFFPCQYIFPYLLPFAYHAQPLNATQPNFAGFKALFFFTFFEFKISFT